MIPLLLVAASVGLSNLAAAVGIGLGGVTARTRWQVGVVFGVFEAGMPIVGLVIGAGLATGIGELARWIGAALLIVMGGITAIRALRQPAAEATRDDADGDRADGTRADGTRADGDRAAHPGEPGSAGRGDGAGHPDGRGIAASPGRLILSAFALSLDNLAAGFALGTMNIPVAEGAIVIGAVSVLLSLIGLELGKRIGVSAGRRSEQIGGVILVAVGVAMAAGVL